MNFKTTGLLLAAIAIFGLGYLWTPKKDDASPSTKPPTPSGSVAAKSVIDPKLGDITKIECRIKGEEWVFEKSGDANATTSAWKMTKPLNIKVQGFDVDRIARQITNLQYEISLEPGKPGAVSAAQAGLEPVETLVTLTDVGGKSATLEIGNPASPNESYVRIPGKTQILVGATSLRNMLKPRAIEYRDPQLWNFTEGKVARVEIIDRTTPEAPVNYRFARDGARWQMEAPAAAHATAKVDELLQAMSRLRITKWEDDRADRVAAYGLQSPMLSIKITVEEEVSAEEGKDASKGADAESGKTAEAAIAAETPTESAEKPKTVKKETSYELHVSALSPVGEETKTYVRAGDENAVASIMKTMTEKFKPVMAEWRDMRITSANAAAATRIDYATPEGIAVLTQKEDGWYFDPGKEGKSPARADDESVNALLQQVQNLAAAAFIDDSVEVLASANFTRPAADLRLTIPGVDGTERISVGGFTDAQTKLMRYARRNDSKSVAKVKLADVSVLLAGPRALRNRNILAIPRDEISEIAISLENRFLDGRMEFTLSKSTGMWVQAAPVAAPIRADRLEALLTSISALTAVAVVADEAELSAYGLQDPAAKITITHGTPPVPDQLLATVHDGKFYAQRTDRPAIYEIPESVYQVFFEEFRLPEVMKFDPAKVVRFSIRAGELKHSFERAGAKWKYLPEPDFSLDPKKVENLLVPFHDLKTDRYVSYGAEPASRLGLTPPAFELVIEVENEPKMTLLVSEKTTETGPNRSHYAQLAGESGVFLLPSSVTDQLKLKLESLE